MAFWYQNDSGAFEKWAPGFYICAVTLLITLINYDYLIFSYGTQRTSNLPVPHSGSQGMAGTVLFVGTLHTLGVGMVAQVGFR